MPGRPRRPLEPHGRLERERTEFAVDGEPGTRHLVQLALPPSHLGSPVSRADLVAGGVVPRVLVGRRDRPAVAGKPVPHDPHGSPVPHDLASRTAARRVRVALQADHRSVGIHPFHDPYVADPIDPVTGEVEEDDGADLWAPGPGPAC